MKNQLSFGNNE